MRRTKPMTLLLVMVVAIPLAVVVAGAASFLLLRAGYGILFSAVLPFAGLILLTGGLGLALGRAAGGGRGEGRGRGPRRRDDV